MTEDQPNGQEDHGYIPPDTGVDSNLMAFLAANKIDLTKLDKTDNSKRTPEELRTIGILKAVSDWFTSFASV